MAKELLHQGWDPIGCKIIIVTGGNRLVKNFYQWHPVCKLGLSLYYGPRFLRGNQSSVGQSVVIGLQIYSEQMIYYDQSSMNNCPTRETMP